MKRKLKRRRGRTTMRVAKVLGTYDFFFFFFFFFLFFLFFFWKDSSSSHFCTDTPLKLKEN